MPSIKLSFKYHYYESNNLAVNLPANVSARMPIFSASYTSLMLIDNNAQADLERGPCALVNESAIISFNNYNSLVEFMSQVRKLIPRPSSVDPWPYIGATNTDEIDQLLVLLNFDFLLPSNETGLVTNSNGWYRLEYKPGKITNASQILELNESLLDRYVVNNTGIYGHKQTIPYANDRMSAVINFRDL